MQNIAYISSFSAYSRDSSGDVERMDAMHDVLIIVSFLGVIMAPCVLAMRTGVEDAEDLET
jgi:hypothetical protein